MPGMGLGLTLNPAIRRYAGEEGGGTPTPTPTPAELGEELLDEAVIFVDWSDAANNSNVYARNQNDARTHTANLIAFPTGLTTNESGSANPPRTLFYANGPDGLGNATRVLTTATSQIWYVYRTSVNGALPAGEYTFRFRARSLSGSAHPMTFGQGFAGSGSAPISTDWSDTAGTTFTHTFTYNGTSGDIAIRFTDSGSDVLIDHLQLYPGNAAAMPAWGADGVPAGGRRGSNFLTLDGDNNVTVSTTGMTLIDPLFPAKRSLTAYTMVTVQTVTAAPSGACHMMNQHANDGGTTTANNLSVVSASPNAGEIVGFASSTSQQDHAFNTAGKGVFMFAQMRDATTRRTFFGGTQALTEARAFAGINVARWQIGGFNTSAISAVNTNMCAGTYLYNMVWDRALTAEEMRNLAAAIEARMTARTLSFGATNDGQIVISSMSNGQKGTGDWTNYISQNAWISATRNLYQTNTSVGGQGIDNIERNASGAESGLAEGTITENGRFHRRDKPALLGAAMAGPVGYMIDCLVNDWDQMNASSAAAVAARHQAIYELAEALDPNVCSLVPYPIPQSTANAGRENFETQRHAFMTAMRTWIALDPTRRFEWGIGATATVGDIANIGTHLQGDGIHLIPSTSNVGDDAVADDFVAFCLDWWDDVGVAA